MNADSDGLVSHYGVIHVSHHVLLLAEMAFHPGGAIPEPLNGLAVGGQDCAFIFTGIHTGCIGLTVEIFDRSPGHIEFDWDDVVEVSLEASRGRVQVTTLLGEGVPDDFPQIITTAGATTYRVRVHARGRDTDIDGTAFEPFEQYLIQIWPSSRAPDILYKGVDGYGAQWRRLTGESGPRGRGAPKTAPR